MGWVGFGGLRDQVVQIKHATAAAAAGVSVVLKLVERGNRLCGEDLAEFRFRYLEAVTDEVAHGWVLVL